MERTDGDADDDIELPARLIPAFSGRMLAVVRELLGDFPIDCAAGLSLGEMTAHAVAGTFDFATGLKLVQKRGELMDEACAATLGGMAAMIGARRMMFGDWPPTKMSILPILIRRDKL